MIKNITKKPPHSSYFVQIDGLRTLAISAVMFGHWTLILPSFERAAKFAAFSGVDLFFVISGFLITGILLKYKGIIHTAMVIYFDNFISAVFFAYSHATFFKVLAQRTLKNG